MKHFAVNRGNKLSSKFDPHYLIIEIGNYFSISKLGLDHRQGDENFFSKKIEGRGFFFQKILGGEDFLTSKFENPRFYFSKKGIFVGSSDSSVLIGVEYIQNIH